MHRSPFRLQGLNGSGMWKICTRASANSKMKAWAAKVEHFEWQAFVKVKHINQAEKRLRLTQRNNRPEMWTPYVIRTFIFVPRVSGIEGLHCNATAGLIVCR